MPVYSCVVATHRRIPFVICLRVCTILEIAIAANHLYVCISAFSYVRFWAVLPTTAGAIPPRHGTAIFNVGHRNTMYVYSCVVAKHRRIPFVICLSVAP